MKVSKGKEKCPVSLPVVGHIARKGCHLAGKGRLARK
jgi:hypothetical protein